MSKRLLTAAALACLPAADVRVLGPFGVTVAYRNVGKKSAATGSWDFANVLVTSAKLSF